MFLEFVQNEETIFTKAGENVNISGGDYSFS